MRLFFYPNPLDNRVIIPRQRRAVNSINNKYYVMYRGEVMTMADFARLIGVDYARLRRRAIGGSDLFSPMMNAQTEATKKKEPEKTYGYSLEELAEMYSHFRDTEGALDVLADFACLRRKSSAVVRLEKQIQKYLEEKRKEVQG